MRAAAALAAAALLSGARALAPAHLPVNANFGGLRYVHRDPDVLVLENFLDPRHCDELVAAGRAATLERSPVAYAGRTEDFSDLVQTWASGPAVWLALLAVLARANLGGVADRLDLAATAAGAYALNLALAGVAAYAFVDQREANLQKLRTSKSTALRGTPGAAETTCFARLLEALPGTDLETCEALTLIKYDPGDALAPHYDANRAAAVEDAARGGQTLATLLVYLNDVAGGGRTKFGKLDVAVDPRKGDACLFFPADASGGFDDRLEHEGEAPLAEKWIGRVWVHEAAIAGATGCPAATRDAVRGAG